MMALLRPPSAVAAGYLDPADTTSGGSHALADILSAHGHHVIRTTTPATAVAAADRGSATLVITTPWLLTARQLEELARVRTRLVLVEPDRAALAALAPGVVLHGVTPFRPLAPGCELAAARLAGRADMGGPALRPSPGVAATRCYRAAGGASLLRYDSGDIQITVLSTGTPLTNGSLAHLGNAALALNLLGARPDIVWLAPHPRLGLGSSANRPKSLFSLIPLPAYLIAIQLGVAVLLAAAWRARRLGPLATEPLPVVVRACETVEGHGRLYRARRARGRAAAALRAAALSRILPALGLAPGAGPTAVLQALSGRPDQQHGMRRAEGSAAARAEDVLFGPEPRDDVALVALADDLDALEREVRAQ